MVVNDLSPLSHEDRVAIAKNHFSRKGYRVHSGLQFGCELVLYADSPGRVHSDFCVHVVPPNSRVNWMQIQTLARSMSTLHKQLIIVDILSSYDNNSPDDSNNYSINEIAVASGHAPFRHKRNVVKKVGSQLK
jgi:tRNA splicing endonuclease